MFFDVPWGQRVRRIMPYPGCNFKSHYSSGQNNGLGPSAETTIKGTSKNPHPVDVFRGAHESFNAVCAVEKGMKSKILEWAGVVTAIVYALLVSFNIGAEFLAFSLLLFSAICIGLWAYFGNHKGILWLQLFYAAAGVIGMIRWI